MLLLELSNQSLNDVSDFKYIIINGCQDRSVSETMSTLTALKFKGLLPMQWLHYVYQKVVQSLSSRVVITDCQHTHKA